MHNNASFYKKERTTIMRLIMITLIPTIMMKITMLGMQISVS